MHRFYIDPTQSSNATLLLNEREAHHATSVLRVAPGERVVALDGAGSELLCVVDAVTRRDVRLKVQQRNHVPPLPYQLTLIQAIPKNKTMEVIVQKATELGVHRIVPVIAERSVPHLDNEKAEARVEKWNWIAIDSIKQCGSAWLPKIELPVKPQAFIGTEKPDITLLATLQADGRHPRLHIQDFVAEKKRRPKFIHVWIGPEGDLTPAEINAVRGSGALPITLGQLILRSETAAIYALSVLNYELQAPE